MQRSTNQGCQPAFLRILNILAAAGFGLAALSLFISSTSGQADPTQSFYKFTLAVFLGFLLLVHLFSLVTTISSRPRLVSEQKSRSYLLPASISLLAWGGIVFLVEFLIRKNTGYVAIPILLILAAALPIWWFVELGRRKLLHASSLQTWGSVSVGTSLTTLGAMLIEFILIFALVLIGLITLSGQPGLINDLSRLSQQLQANPNLQETQKLIGTALQNPVVIILVFTFMSILVPIVEELAKPLGVYIFGGRRLTPSQGFVMGLICGACFGFMETMLLLTTSVQQGVYEVILVRVATGLLHTVNTGLTSWGFVSARFDKKPGRWLLCLLAAIFLHGTWNAFGALIGVSPFLTQNLTLSFPAAASLAKAAPFVLGFLSLVMLAILVLLNRHLQKTREKEIASITQPPPIPIQFYPPPYPGNWNPPV